MAGSGSRKSQIMMCVQLGRSKLWSLVLDNIYLFIASIVLDSSDWVSTAALLSHWPLGPLGKTHQEGAR